MRVTEQGEVIAQKYANRVTATFQLERLLAGVTRTTLLHSAPHQETQALESIWPKVVEISFQAYRKLVETDGFVTFFRQATPIDAIEQTQLGSRPSRRTGAGSLDDLRAIPWVFSWSQARFHLPGWYGVGTALDWLRPRTPRGLATPPKAGPRMAVPVLFTAQRRSQPDDGQSGSHAALRVAGRRAVRTCSTQFSMDMNCQNR